MYNLIISLQLSATAISFKVMILEINELIYAGNCNFFPFRTKSKYLLFITNSLIKIYFDQLTFCNI